MTLSHPLDRAASSALQGRHARYAVVEGGARRYHPAYGVFASLDDGSETSLAGLAALVAAHGDVAFLDANPPPPVPGLEVVSQDLGVQMVSVAIAQQPLPDVPLVRLRDADAPDMRALAALTQPGPFFERTHRLGEFFGVRPGGELVAMAGERMKPDGHVEVSGVCTHPDHRGRGFAGALMQLVAGRVLARGEVPFLHAYASNKGAIDLYKALGFIVRREVLMTRLARA